MTKKIVLDRIEEGWKKNCIGSVNFLKIAVKLLFQEFYLRIYFSDTYRLFRYESIFDAYLFFRYGSIRIDFSDMVRLDRIGLSDPKIFIILDRID
jgi:hypothetical protein